MCVRVDVAFFIRELNNDALTGHLFRDNEAILLNRRELGGLVCHSINIRLDINYIYIIQYYPYLNCV